MDAEEHQSFRWRSKPSDAVWAVSRRLQRLPAHHIACKQRSVLACHCTVWRLRRSFPDCRWPVKVEDQYTHAAFPAFFDTGWHILHAHTNTHSHNPTVVCAYRLHVLQANVQRHLANTLQQNLGGQYFRFIFSFTAKLHSLMRL